MKAKTIFLILALILLLNISSVLAISGDVAIATSPIAYYSLDQNSTTHFGITNLVNPGLYNMSLNTTNTNTSFTNNGFINGAYNFKGEIAGTKNIFTDTKSDNPIITGDGNRSYSLWVNSSFINIAPGNIIGLFQTGDGMLFDSYYSLGINIDNDDSCSMFITTASAINIFSNSFNCNSTIYNSNWTNYIVEYNGSNQFVTGETFFLNGVNLGINLTDSSAGSGTADTGVNGMLLLGTMSNYNTPNQYNYIIDEFGIWNYPLNQSSINYLYNNGSGALYNGFREVQQNYSSPVSTLSTNNFNISLNYDSNFYSSISSTLIYNNTQYSSNQIGIGSNIGFNSTTTAPLVSSNTNTSFYWKIELVGNNVIYYFNSTVNNQTINTVFIDNCTTYTNKIINFSMFDEDTQGFIGTGVANNVSMNIYVVLSALGTMTPYISYNLSTTSSPTYICISGLNASYNLNLANQYSSQDRITRWNYMQDYSLNSSDVPINRPLYDLLTTESQEFQITYKDQNFLPVSNALVEIEKFYPSLGLFIPIEYGLTDSYGVTLGHFVLGTNVYAINVYVNGILVSNYPSITPTCSDLASGICEINLNAQSSAGVYTNYLTYQNLNYYYNFSQSSRQLILNWQLQSTSYGSSSINQIVYADDSLNNAVICSQSSTGVSGIYICNINQTYGNTTMTSYLYKDGILVSTTPFTITNNEQQVYGNTGIIIAFVFVVCIALMFSGSATGVVIGGVLGLITVSTLALINLANNNPGNGLLALSGGLVWIIVCAGIIVWKINKNGGSS